MKVNREELAWAAGFFDGEGWTGCYHKEPNTRYLMLAINQNDCRPLKRFQKAVFGTGRIRGPIKSCQGPNYHYRFEAARFEHVQAIVAAMWPFLCEPKKEQAERALRAYHTVPHRVSRTV